MHSGLGIWRALDRARAMNLSEEGEPPPRPGGDGITRRRVLAALTAGAGSALLPRMPAFAQVPQRIAIVGGGLAGLSALDALASQGVAATLYEARGATGGRTRSVRGVFGDDFAFDEGGQLVNSDHADMMRLVRRLGLTLVDRRGFGPVREVQIGRSGRTVSEASLARSLRRIARQITADADRLDREYETVAREIDALSVADYLDRHEMRSGDARDALEAGIRTEYGAEPRDASALELLFNLPTVDGARLTRIGLSDERYLISGGSGQVAARLAAAHEGAIRLGKRLEALNSGGTEVRMEFADGEEVRADNVILALPGPLLREVRFEGPMPSAWRALIDEVRLGRNEKVIVGYDRQALRDQLGFGGALWAGQPFAAAWDAASVAPGEAPGGAICYFLGGDQVDAAAAASASELAARFSDAARRALPRLPRPNGLVRRTRWCDDPFSKGSYVNWRPGQLTRFGSLMAVEEEGGETRAAGFGPIHFAGEWLSDAWPGYMNGAVQTGRLAAEAAMMPAPAELLSA